MRPSMILTTAKLAAELPDLSAVLSPAEQPAVLLLDDLFDGAPATATGAAPPTDVSIAPATATGAAPPTDVSIAGAPPTAGPAPRAIRPATAAAWAFDAACLPIESLRRLLNAGHDASSPPRRPRPRPAPCECRLRRRWRCAQRTPTRRINPWTRAAGAGRRERRGRRLGTRRRRSVCSPPARPPSRSSWSCPRPRSPTRRSTSRRTCSRSAHAPIPCLASPTPTPSRHLPHPHPPPPCCPIFTRH